MARILIVEDRELDRKFLMTLLQAAGYQALCAEDGKHGLDLICREAPDLAIADLLMPTMDGFEFVQRLRKGTTGADTPVIF